MARDLFGGIFTTALNVDLQLTSTALTALGLPSNTGVISVSQCLITDGGWLAAYHSPSANVVNRYVFPPQSVVFIRQLAPPD